MISQRSFVGEPFRQCREQFGPKRSVFRASSAFCRAGKNERPRFFDAVTNAGMPIFKPLLVFRMANDGFSGILARVYGATTVQNSARKNKNTRIMIFNASGTIDFSTSIKKRMDLKSAADNGARCRVPPAAPVQSTSPEHSQFHTDCHVPPCRVQPPPVRRGSASRPCSWPRSAPRFRCPPPTRLPGG